MTGAKVGRPSLYRPEYCDKIVEIMREGLSVNSFAASVGVSRDTVYEWSQVHPEFSVALKKGKAIAAAWYELQQKKLIEQGGVGAQASLIAFGLRNMGMGEWKDKQEVEHTGDVTVHISKEQRDAAVRAALEDD